jgi:hypothetical protein
LRGRFEGAMLTGIRAKVRGRSLHWYFAMADLKNKHLIVGKGLLFLLIIVLSSAGLLCLAPERRTVVLLAVLVWASARSYYFLFYVLHHYVDERYQYAGVVALIRSIVHNRRIRPKRGTG